MPIVNSEGQLPGRWGAQREELEMTELTDKIAAVEAEIREVERSTFAVDAAVPGYDEQARERELKRLRKKLADLTDQA
jgi:hypothetical protein